MRTYWSETRPTGKPIDPGTFCLVSDMEDGTNEIYTYGATKEECYEKIALNNLHARKALDRATTRATMAAPIIPARTPLTGDQVVQATQDLQIAGKAGKAAAQLIADETGVDLERMANESFKRLAEEWVDEHEDFYSIPANVYAVADLAGQRVNRKLGLITKELLTQCFEELRARGVLVEMPEPEEETTNPQPLPGASPVQRTERQSGRYATGMPSNRLRAAQTVQPKTLKYTAEQIRTMPEATALRLIESNDPDYAHCCEVHFGETRATA